MTDPAALPFLPRRPRSAYINRRPGRRSPGDARGWHKGWPAGMEPGDLVAVITTRPDDGRTFRVRVDRRLGALVGLLLAMIQEVGYPLIGAQETTTTPTGKAVKQGGVGSYNNRPIKTQGGDDEASEHSRGLALDLWSRSNPQRWGREIPFASTQHPLAVRLFVAAGFEWGGHFHDLRPRHTYIDAMHIEYRGRPQDVAQSIATLKAEYQAITGELEPAPEPEEPDVTPAQIKVLQAKLNEAGTNPPLVIDGVYGAATESAVVALPGTVSTQVEAEAAEMKEAAKQASSAAIDGL